MVTYSSLEEQSQKKTYKKWNIAVSYKLLEEYCRRAKIVQTISGITHEKNNID
jgi:hypothetical protein